jgi:predicted amidophosphoribosyltransferase
MRILPILLDALFPPRETEILVRALDADALSRLIEPKIIRNEEDFVIGLLPYALDAVRACILEAKFHDNMRAAQLLGAALSDFLYEFLNESAPFIYDGPIFLPLPLSKKRAKERGYNQAERIVRAAVSMIPQAALDTGLLSRTRDTAPQTTLGGQERRRNLVGAFAATPCDPIRTYIMVDDVTTTGSTIAAARTAMREGGGVHLIAVTLAY